MRNAQLTLFTISMLAFGSTLLGQEQLDAGVPEPQRQSSPLIAVSGSGVHYFDSAIVHSSKTTATGEIRRSTETVELNGDLVGRLLYHPVSVFDFVKGTLVNTGHQVFSGTIRGSEPVMLHDDDFRFEVDLTTGATVGKVHLIDRLDGPNVRCHLDVVGTGLTADGNATFDYAGECRIETRDKRDRKETDPAERR